MRGKEHLAVILALCSVLLGPGCARHSGDEEGEAKAAEPVAEVTVTQVRRDTLSSTVEISGTIAALPNHDVKVSSLVPGRVAQILVAEGDLVKQGQLVARIDARPQADQYRQAEAAVEQARATLQNARQNLTRNENLFQRGIAARKEVEDARTQVSVAEGALAQAEAAARLARLQVSRAEVHAPLSGAVVKRFTSSGEQVDGTAGQPLVEIADLSQVEMFASLPASYLGAFRSGQALELAGEGEPTRKFNGRVVAVSPSVDPATNVGTLRIRFPNPGRALLLGMFLRGAAPVATHRNALVVPPAAVYRGENNEPRVFRVKEQTAEAVPVRIGIETREATELLSGVDEGETVVLAGGYGLPERARIKVAK